ncbi:hypothetical protein NEOLEDRAFT_323808 [Neolentinus lepideus HHB14362 ss-1]|uniref:Uncharacterized protein n=1 Tax=Neolentinus lepideus HHB14362 ss-1 TaxID=1314782 RepID=A0A165VWI0_9AGAM|nr:hypothetical protein NEOLEDRAFT_323808 [Neolentinus lepideus HHB14362 ss-1]
MGFTMLLSQLLLPTTTNSCVPPALFPYVVSLTILGVFYFSYVLCLPYSSVEIGRLSNAIFDRDERLQTSIFQSRNMVCLHDFAIIDTT